MLNKSDIIILLRKYNINPNEVILISGSAMVINDVKPFTSDIDFTVSPLYEKYLLQNFNCSLEKIVDNNNVWYIDDLFNFSSNYFGKINYDYLYGYMVQKPQDVLNLKLNLNRKKDKKDILLLEKYLKGLLDEYTGR